VIVPEIGAVDKFSAVNSGIEPDPLGSKPMAVLLLLYA